MDIKVGNVVRMLKKDWVVIEKDSLVAPVSKGDDLHADIFTTISKEDFDNAKVNPKEKTWTIKDISTMHSPNEILSSKIEIVD